MQAVKDTLTSALESISLSSPAAPSGMVGKIHSYPDNPRVVRALAAAQLNGCQVEVVPVQMGVSNKTPEYLAKFPTGKVPAFEGTDGFCLSESAAIAYYLASMSNAAQLMGANSKDTAKVHQWIYWADLDLGANLNTIVYMILGYTAFNKQSEIPAYANIDKAMHVLEKVLQNCTFLVGERITLADLTVASILAVAFSMVLGEEERKAFPNAVRYYQTIANRPEIKKFFEGRAMCATAQKPQPPKKEEKPKKEAAAPKPKPAAKAPAAKDEEEEDETLKEEVVKSPLDALPKSTFDLNAWKSFYSNNDTRGPGGALEYFYKNFDAEGYSVWKTEFKYNDELTHTFMSNNQIGGFFNRLEGSRKYLFGSMGVCGVTNKSAIAGAFIARGQDITIPISAAPDWESYSYTKLDLSKDEDKKYFEDAMAWELEIDGKAWADGKNFK